MEERIEVTENNLPSDDEILRVEHLKKYFPIAKNLLGKTIVSLKAVDDVSFSVKKGTTIGVVGESGCGKTTLGRTILRLHDSDGGTIRFEGEDITKLKKKQMRKYRTDIQLIFQDPYSSLPPRMTVGSIIAEPVRVHKIVPKNEVYEYVIDIMKKCGLQPQYYDRYPTNFRADSGRESALPAPLRSSPSSSSATNPCPRSTCPFRRRSSICSKSCRTPSGLPTCSFRTISPS